MDLNSLTTINDVVVGDDVTIRGNGKSTSRGRRDNLILLRLSFLFGYALLLTPLCFTFCLASFLYLWVFPCVLKFIVFPDAFLNSSVSIGEGALSVHPAIPPFTDIFVPIGRGVGALSVPFAIPVFTDIFSATGIGVGALSVVFVIPEFTDIFVSVG